MKSDFDKKMVWGNSEIGKGGSNAVEPCAKPGCSPFPTCCATNNAMMSNLKTWSFKEKD